MCEERGARGNVCDAAFKKDNKDSTPSFAAVSGYDGLHVICAALKKTSGRTDGRDLVVAMEGLQWESPRGSVTIDATTRDIVQDLYLRRLETSGPSARFVDLASILEFYSSRCLTCTTVRDQCMKDCTGEGKSKEKCEEECKGK